jgi:hypothetical protein
MKTRKYANEHTLHAFEESPADSEEAQITFMSALTASAVGIAATGSLDYAWNSFEEGFKDGTFFQCEEEVACMQ